MKSQNRCIVFLIRSAMAVLIGLGLALLLNVQAVAETQLDVLKTKTDTFENVTVTGRNQTDIFITHSKGMGNVKIKDLDAETLWKLGLGPQPASAGTTVVAGTKGTPQAVPTASAAGGSLGSGAESEALAALPPELQEQMQAAMAFQEGMPEIAISSINPVVIGAAIAIVLFFHLFFSYCLKLIVEKAGAEPGLMVWLPFFQVFPMFRAAGMSGWWVVALFVPVLGIVPMIMWPFKIVEARGKSVWVAVALLLPVVSLFAFLYLAFSSGDESDADDQPLAGAQNGPPVLLEA